MSASIQMAMCLLGGLILFLFFIFYWAIFLGEAGIVLSLFFMSLKARRWVLSLDFKIYKAKDCMRV